MEPVLYSTAELRRANRNRVYRYLYESVKPVTKQDLALALSMSLPTLTQNLNELLERGLIDNSEIADSTGGRKPHIFSVVSSAHFAIGAEISPRHIRIVAMDLGIHEIAFSVLERHFQVGDEYARGLAEDIERFIAEHNLNRDKLLGVGVTLPGVISADQQTIESAPTLKVHRMGAEEIIRYIPYSVSLTNDANAGGFAEWRNRTNLASIAYVSLSRGVGGAILMNGVPYEGTSQRSGEFGHMCIHPGERECSCGKRGCLEAYCSTARLSDDLNISLEEFFVQVEGGNQKYCEIWETYLDDLSIGIINIHTALDCDVVLGGSLTQYAGEYLEGLNKRLELQDSFWEGKDYVHLCRYHGKSNSIGAALKFVDTFLNEI